MTDWPVFQKGVIGQCLLQLREEAARLFDQPGDRLCLVYGGKIMKDEDGIKSYGVKNQHSIHLVIRNPPRQSASASAAAAPDVASSGGPPPPGICDHRYNW